MRSRRRGGWWRGWKRRGTSSLLYRPHLVIEGRRGHILLHARPNQGGGVLCRWRRRKWKLEKFYEEVKRREDKHNKTKLTPLLFMHAQARPKPGKIMYARYVCSLCLCFVGFLCAQVSYKIRKNPGHLLLPEGHMYTHVLSKYRARNIFMTKSFLFNIQNKSFHHRVISVVHKGMFYNVRCLFTLCSEIVTLINQ